MSDKLIQMAKDLLTIETDFPCRLENETPLPTVDDFEIYCFEQTWGSTALGFGGIGGQAITTAMTYVFIPICCNQKCLVYFAGRFAYSVPYNDIFMSDVLARNMAPVYKSWKYNTKE